MLPKHTFCIVRIHIGLGGLQMTQDALYGLCGVWQRWMRKTHPGAANGQCDRFQRLIEFDLLTRSGKSEARRALAFGRALFGRIEQKGLWFWSDDVAY